ncbi:MAG: VIT1/CCC1 transporter family protein [Candidatus Helarchaeota archaeon]
MVSFWKRWKDYVEISEVGPIVRRFFVMNAFDGSLTTLGIIMGAFISNNLNIAFGSQLISFIVATGLATALSMGISGIWGSYLTEAAEHTKEVRDIEMAMGKKQGELEHTLFAKARRFAAILAAIVDGVSPAGAALVCMIPFFLVIGEKSFWYSNGFVFPISLILTFIMLFVLGIFLGKISKKNLVLSGIKMLFAGFLVMVLSLLFPS